MQRFIDNGDNTVTDTKTGLIWTKNTVAKDVDFADAEKAVAELGEGWRIPTVDELATLVDRTRYEPAIDVEAFPDTANDWYWTQTPCAWAEKSAVWVVDFDDGIVLDYYRTFVCCVRAVRSGQ
ncbi:MAG: DUF1566 domain-containing protein [Lysobacterales bacterium]